MTESFWDFSVRTYRTENVPEACLALQDERGVDVNMLLYCCWYGATRGTQDLECFNRTFDFSENWASHVVRPLRGVRTWMKHNGCQDPRMPTERCMEYREKVKGVEFTAEKIQQDVLESLTEKAVQENLNEVEKLKAVIENVRQYLVIIDIKLDEFVKGHLTTIIEAALVGHPREGIIKALTK